MAVLDDQQTLVDSTHPQWAPSPVRWGRVLLGAAVALAAITFAFGGLVSVGRASLAADDALRLVDQLRLDDRLDPELDLEREFVLWDWEHGPHVRIVVDGANGEITPVVEAIGPHLLAEGYAEVFGSEPGVDGFARNRDDSLDADWLIVRAVENADGAVDDERVEIIHTVFDTDSVLLAPVLVPLMLVLATAGGVIAWQGVRRREGLDPRPPPVLRRDPLTR